MSTLLLMRPLLTPRIAFPAIGLSLTLYHLSTQRPYRLDTPTALSSSPFSSTSYAQNAKTPVVTSKGRLNPRAVRQVSLGSVTGLCAGLLVSTFSKSLALLLGLMVVGVQVASSYGINIIPYGRLQKYVQGIDLRSAVQDNVALKVSFGTTFALAGFMSF